MNRHRPYCPRPTAKPDMVIRADTRDTWRLPDNFVQAPGFTQSYNRYSYCLNNPLQWVDPSGEDMLDPWYRDAIGIVRWTDSEFNMPVGGFFLGDEGVFTSDDEMRYYYADGRISNIKLQQVFIDWGNPMDFTFSSFPMRGAGSYRIGDPAEQTGNFSTNFHYVAPIDPGYINGLNGYGVANGAKTNLIEAAVRYNFSDSQKWYQFRILGNESKIRIEKTLGRVGSKYLKMSKMLGGAASVTSTVIEITNYGIYTTTNGFDWMVTTKFGMDLIMTGIGFLGPVGLIVSTSYFILDVTTDGFGGFGKMY